MSSTDRPRAPLAISQRLAHPQPAQERLVLPFELRSRSRFRARLASGEEVGVVLPRGQILRGGDLLRAADGRVIEVVAAAETLSSAYGADPSALARAAYHLGNRHVALQLGPSWLRYLHDHVLDEMVRGLGLTVHSEQAPFEPEAGAYAAHAHSPPASNAHAQAHRHETVAPDEHAARGRPHE